MCIQQHFNIAMAKPASDFDRFSQDIDVACREHPANEGDPPYRDREMVKVDDKVGRQLTPAPALAILHGRLESQALVDMLLIDGEIKPGKKNEFVDAWRDQVLPLLKQQEVCRSSNGWNQPLKFSTAPFHWGRASGMKTGCTPKRKAKRMTRFNERA